jgi:hypothetical protein
MLSILDTVGSKEVTKDSSEADIASFMRQLQELELNVKLITQQMA